MTVDDFIDLCTENFFTLNIYDNKLGKVVWTGEAVECPEAYGYEQVGSFDMPEKKWEMTINLN